MLYVVEGKDLKVAKQILVLILVSTPVILLSPSIYNLEAGIKSGVGKKEPKIQKIFLQIVLATPKLSNSQLHRDGIGLSVLSVVCCVLCVVSYLLHRYTKSIGKNTQQNSGVIAEPLPQ